jgi:hypothetical protein
MDDKSQFLYLHELTMEEDLVKGAWHASGRPELHATTPGDLASMRL